MSDNIEKPDPFYGSTGDIEVVSSNKPKAKVVAATGGSALGVATSVVAIYIIETAVSIDIPVAVEGAAAVIFTALLTFAAGWIKKD